MASPTGREPSPPRAVRVDRTAELADAAREVGAAPGRPALVLVGGAAGLSGAELSRLRPLFAEALVPAAEALGACVIDGGTAAGVMGLMGEARARAGASFPLIGVAVSALVAPDGALPARGDAAPVEPNHTGIVLVPGSRWGEETPWIAELARVVADGCPSATVLVDGGEIAREDAAASVREGRPVIVVAGSGRAADALAAASSGEPGGGAGGLRGDTGLVSVVQVGDPPALRRAVERALSGRR